MGHMPGRYPDLRVKASDWPSRENPSGVSALLAAYSCGCSYGIGPEPAPHSLLIPERAPEPDMSSGLPDNPSLRQRSIVMAVEKVMNLGSLVWFDVLR